MSVSLFSKILIPNKMENENKGFFSKLAGMIGKELSEEVTLSLDKELDEFKQLIINNQFLETIPNLELETYEIPVTSAGQEVKITSKTKIEHEKVLAVFLTHRNSAGTLQANRNSKLSIQIDRKYVFTEGEFHYTLLEKSEGMTIYESSWRTNIRINNSDVEVKYTDGSTVTPPYSAYVHLICKKK
jgi:hypothetical protein